MASGWTVEDCRHLSRRLEADLLAEGERIVRVPHTLIGPCLRRGSHVWQVDPIDAFAVARAALRHPDLPAAQLKAPASQLRLLVDHREGLVAERTRCINRLLWHLHELDPGLDPPARSLCRYVHLDAIAGRLAGFEGMVARNRDLTRSGRALEIPGLLRRAATDENLGDGFG